MSTTIQRVLSSVKTEEDEKLYELRIILQDEQGTLARTTKVLSDFNTNIKTASLFYLPRQNGVGSWTCFADTSKAERSIPELKEELQSLDVIMDVKKRKTPLIWRLCTFHCCMETREHYCSYRHVLGVVEWI